MEEMLHIEFHLFGINCDPEEIDLSLGVRATAIDVTGGGDGKVWIYRIVRQGEINTREACNEMLNTFHKKAGAINRLRQEKGLQAQLWIEIFNKPRDAYDYMYGESPIMGIGLEPKFMDFFASISANVSIEFREIDGDEEQCYVPFNSPA